jgi:hypothetical protein
MPMKIKQNSRVVCQYCCLEILSLKYQWLSDFSQVCGEEMLKPFPNIIQCTLNIEWLRLLFHLDHFYEISYVETSLVSVLWELVAKEKQHISRGIWNWKFSQVHFFIFCCVSFFLTLILVCLFFLLSIFLYLSMKCLCVILTLR